MHRAVEVRREGIGVMKKPKLFRHMLFAVCLAYVGLLGTDSALAQSGEALFKQKCANCHNPEGTAEIISPAKFAGVQWERYFKRNRHERKLPIADLFSKEEIELILEYLKDHAADSDQPISAGVR